MRICLDLAAELLAAHAGHAAGQKSDPERVAIDGFGAWGEKEMQGKTYEGVIRSTFVIGEDGIILKAWPRVNPINHALEVLEVL